MVNELLDLYDLLVEKEKQIMKALNIFGVDVDTYFLGDATLKIEWQVVKLLGATTEKQIENILEESVFHDYREGEITKEELITSIKDGIQ